MYVYLTFVQDTHAQLQCLFVLVSFIKSRKSHIEHVRWFDKQFKNNYIFDIQFSIPYTIHKFFYLNLS